MASAGRPKKYNRSREYIVVMTGGSNLIDADFTLGQTRAKLQKQFDFARFIANFGFTKARNTMVNYLAGLLNRSRVSANCALL
jgi:small basic protein